MNCFSEFTYSVYADGELSAAESGPIEAHLAVCPVCRERLNILRNENIMISNVLAEARDELATLPDLQPTSPSGLIFGALGALAGATLGLRAIVMGFSEWGLSQLGLLDPLTKALDWLNPASWTARFDLFFATVFYLVQEGASMLSIITLIATVVLIAALLTGTVMIARRRPVRMQRMVMLVAALALVAVPRASALELHKSEGAYVLPAGQVVNDTLMIAGDTATIDGDINGNLFFGGRRLFIRGNVKGDVFAGTQDVEIQGTVGGNVISFASSMDVAGKVAGSVYTWSQRFWLRDKAVVVGDVLSFCATADLNGETQRDLMLFSGAAELSGKTGRDVTFRGDRVNIESSAKIGRDLTAYLKHTNRARIDSKSIGGKTEILQTEVDSYDTSARYTQGKFYFWQAIQLLAALLTGALLLLLFPGLFRGSVDALGNTWMPVLRSLGLGFGVLIAAPIAMILVCITLIGIPLSIVTLMLYISGIYFAKIFLGAAIGQAIMQRRAQNTQEMLLALLAGLAIYFVAANLPWAIGGIVRFLVLCAGLGAFCYQLAMSVRRPAAVA